MRQTQHPTAQAYDMLASVYSQFTEGRETQDLRRASFLMNRLTRQTAFVQRPCKSHQLSICDSFGSPHNDKGT
jgi:hypothetical protein